MSTILIVDDREFDRILYREYLGEQKFTYIEIDDGDSVEKALHDNKVDLILLDWQMPRMGGLDALRLLKRNPGTAEIPVIIITGLQDESILEEAFNLGSVDFIHKPVSKVELYARVISALTLYEATCALQKQKNELIELNNIITSQKKDLQETMRIRSELTELKEDEFRRELEQKKRSILTGEVKSNKTNVGLNKIRSELVQLYDKIAGGLDSEQTQKEVKRIERVIEELTSTQESWEDFRRMYESINPGFFKKLNSINPRLTALDLKHCAYIRMNIDNFELSQILNVEIKSLQMTRYRIKKKLGLENETLREYLLAL